MDGAFSGSFRKLRREDPVCLATDSCLSIRRPGMECGRCREVCPAGVLSGGLWSVKLETAGCIGCGLCAAECPTGAIRVEGFATQAPGDDIPPGEAPITLECRRVPEELRAEGAEAVPCLGGLGAADLLERAARAGRDVVLADHGWCAGCPICHCPVPWAAAVERATTLMAALDCGEVPIIEVENVPLPAEKALPIAALRLDLATSRRAFLRRLVVPAPEPHSPKESQRIVFGRGLVEPVARDRELAALRDLAGEAGLSPALMPSVAIDAAACDLHGICAAICPTGALRRTEAGGTLAIDFDATACISCGECQRVCPGKALRLDPQGDGTLSDSRRTLVSRARGICVGCGDTFPQGRDSMEFYCQPCRNSRSLMAGLARQRGGALPQV